MMRNYTDKCRLAVVQAEPVLFDAAASLSKALRLIDEAAEGGAELVCFPELFIPGYPYGLSFGFTVGRRDEAARPDWARYAAASLMEGGPELAALRDKARERGVWLSMGFSERDALTGTLYNSNVIIPPDGAALPIHRKLKPTGSERVVWGDANRGYFPVADTPWGRAAALICWEAYMPLARAALYDKGVTILLAPNTNDYDGWFATLRHMAMEGRCFVVNACPLITRASYPGDIASRAEAEALPELICRGGSCVVGPDGEYIAEPFFDREGIIYCELDPARVFASRMEFDPAGHYARPDVLRLSYPDE